MKCEHNGEGGVVEIGKPFHCMLTGVPHCVLSD